MGVNLIRYRLSCGTCDCCDIIFVLQMVMFLCVEEHKTQRMLFYRSLRTDDKHQTEGRQRLGNDDGILMMFVYVCIQVFVYKCVCVCMRESMILFMSNSYQHKYCLDVCVLSVCALFVHLHTVCLCLQPLFRGLVIYEPGYGFHQGRIKLQNSPLLAFFFV